MGKRGVVMVNGNISKLVKVGVTTFKVIHILSTTLLITY